MTNEDSLEEPMDEMYNEILLDGYYYEKMNPEERRQHVEQEHLREMQGFTPPEYFSAPVGGLERYARECAEQMERDEHEQTLSINDMVNQQHFDNSQ